jgi:acetyltransferase
MTCDPIFGPVVLFGEGGVAVEVIRDRAVALPPLNLPLAANLVDRTRVARRLAGYRDRPPADREALLRVLVQVSQLAADLPEVLELDVNPLLADDRGVIALDARVRVARAESAGAKRLAIRAYPRQLEEQIEFAGRKLLLRPIRPEDLPAHMEFFDHLVEEDKQFRFYGRQWPVSREDLGRYVQIDYNREMAFIATGLRDDGRRETLGVVRGISDPDNVQVQMAIIVRSDVKGRGLGHALLEKLVRYFQQRGAREMVAHTTAANRRMLALARGLGFELQEADDRQTVWMRRRL